MSAIVKAEAHPEENPPATLTAICHCGSISITVPEAPKVLNDCQCSICYRSAGAWAYYRGDAVSIIVRENSDFEAPFMSTNPATADELALLLSKFSEEDKGDEKTSTPAKIPSPLSAAALGKSTRVYVWGDKELELHACAKCGNVTHWWHVERLQPWNSRMGVNGRLFEYDVFTALPKKQTMTPPSKRGAIPEDAIRLRKAEGTM